MKRFIAGAVCPECRAVDRLVLEVRAGADGVADEEWQRCVACGYESTRPGSAHESVPRGKPERRVRGQVEIESQTVKIMDLQPKLDAQDDPK